MANELASKTVEDLRRIAVAAIKGCPEASGADHIWSAQTTRVGLIGARGAHHMEANLLCIRCGTTAVLRVAV